MTDQRMNPATTLVWLVPAAMLLLAMAPLPYWYYTLLRLVVTGASAYLAYRQYEADGRVGAWTVALAAIALLFNPLIPIHLPRHVWAIIDPATAVLLIAHLLVWLRRSKVTHP